MDLPQFKGLSYVQFVQWRTNFLANQAVKYQQEHPHADNTPRNGYVIKSNQCENVGLGMDILFRLPMSAVSVLMTDYLRGWSGILQFPQDWWKTYEDWIWDGTVAQKNNLPNASFCNLRVDDIPTPTQLQTMQYAQQIANTPSTNASASRP